MNNCILIGRLTKDIDLRYTQGVEPIAVAAFNLAINRQGKKEQADFPRIIVFGKQAENCEKYLAKGRRVAVEGRIQTGSYQNKNGDTVHTTDVVANRIEFIDFKDNQKTSKDNDIPDSFQAIDEDVPF